MKARSSLFTLFGEFVHPRGDVVWTGTIIAWMKLLGFSEAAVRAAISRSQRTGWVAVQRQGRKSFYALTPEVRWRVHRAVGRLYQTLDRTWDGTWRILGYSIPETHREARDGLRKELLILGFGALQHGVWISPNDLGEEALQLVKAHGLESFVDVFEAKHLGSREPLEIVQSTWDVSALNQTYLAFIEKFSSLELVETPEKAFGFYVHLLHEYRKFLFSDPDLPLELQPSQWRSRDAALLFRKQRAMLQPLVTEYVEQTFVGLP